MSLKNYTSTVPASRSISLIESKLVKCGARNIMKQYDDQERVSCLMFIIPGPDGREMPIKLPARISNCQKMMEAEFTHRTKPETRKKVGAQAERTAWKILYDWVEVQMAMIELAQVDFMEVFMPYVYIPATDSTVYESAKKNNFAGFLPAPTKD